jgi:integrase
MATVNLYLNSRPDRHGNKRVMLVFQSRGKIVKKYIAIKVPDRAWDAKHQRVRPSYPNATLMNAHIAQQKEAWNTELLKLKLAGEQTDTNDFRQVLNKAKNDETTFIDALDRFIEVRKASHSPAFITKYRTLKSDWQGFEAAQKQHLLLNEVNATAVEGFASYLLTEKGNTNNTIAKKQGFLKTFLIWATDEGLLQKGVPKIKKMKSRKARHVALTEAELHQLESQPLSTPTLERVRDVFVFACYTGLRYSDLENLKPENILEQVSDKGEIQRTISLTMIKTRENLVVPLATQAYQILLKYKFQLPVISLQKSNDYIKLAAKEVGIELAVQQVRFRGSERLEVTKPKYEMITSHAARRTFATLSAIRGMNLIVLQRLLGHSDIQQTMDYIMETQTINAEEMKRIWGQ